MQYMIITNDVETAIIAEAAGVSRIFLDMESKGKTQRQQGLNLPLNTHSFEDIAKIRASLKNTNTEIMLRINPLHNETQAEINRAIQSGVDCIMLPYFHTVEEVEIFIRLISGRVKTNLLLETAAAAARIEQILSVPGIDEVHFGLNDLKISLGLDFLFESLAGGFIDFLCEVAYKKNISYGIGGIGPIGMGHIPAELVMKEYVRLRSQRVILSRIFRNSIFNLKKSLAELKAVEAKANSRLPNEIEEDKITFRQKVSQVVKTIRQHEISVDL